MTDERLAEIEARATAAFKGAEYVAHYGRDVPELVAEVRRLRAAMAYVLAAAKPFAGDNWGPLAGLMNVRFGDHVSLVDACKKAAAALAGEG